MTFEEHLEELGIDEAEYDRRCDKASEGIVEAHFRHLQQVAEDEQRIRDIERQV